MKQHLYIVCTKPLTIKLFIKTNILQKKLQYNNYGWQLN